MKTDDARKPLTTRESLANVARNLYRHAINGTSCGIKKSAAKSRLTRSKPGIGGLRMEN